MSQDMYPLHYLFKFRYQIPTFFVALTPDINGHCEIDDLYYAYYEATLDDYYSCLSDEKMTPPITRENVKITVVNNANILLTFVNKRLRENKHTPTNIKTESITIHSRDITVPEEGYVIRIAVSFPCPIKTEN